MSNKSYTPERRNATDAGMAAYLMLHHNAGHKWLFVRPAGEQAEALRRLARAGRVELGVDDDGYLVARLREGGRR